MAEKSKRLRKILEKGGLKGQLKQVGSLDEAQLVLIVNPAIGSQVMFASKDEYKQALENGVTYWEGKETYFLVSANPRNKKETTLRLLTNKFGMEKSKH